MAENLYVVVVVALAKCMAQFDSWEFFRFCLSNKTKNQNINTGEWLLVRNEKKPLIK